MLKSRKETLRHLLLDAGGTHVGRAYVRGFYRRFLNVVYTHYVGEAPPPPHYQSFYSPTCSHASFFQTITSLKRDFDFVSFPELLATQAPVSGITRPRVALTFDDGFNCFDDQLRSWLRNQKIEPHIFLITGCVDNVDLMWRNKLSAIRALTPTDLLVPQYNRCIVSFPTCSPITAAEGLLASSIRVPMAHKDALADALWHACGMPKLAEYLEEYRPYLTWDTIDELRAEGYTFGCHSQTHPLCDKLSEDEVHHEVANSSAMLRERLNIHRISFSYPFGPRLSATTEAQLRSDHGIGCFLGINGTSSPGREPWSIERINIEGGPDSVILAPFVHPLGLATRAVRTPWTRLRANLRR